MSNRVTDASSGSVTPHHHHKWWLLAGLLLLVAALGATAYREGYAMRDLAGAFSSASFSGSNQSDIDDVGIEEDDTGVGADVEVPMLQRNSSSDDDGEGEDYLGGNATEMAEWQGVNATITTTITATIETAAAESECDEGEEGCEEGGSEKTDVAENTLETATPVVTAAAASADEDVANGVSPSRKPTKQRLKPPVDNSSGQKHSTVDDGNNNEDDFASSSPLPGHSRQSRRPNKRRSSRSPVPKPQQQPAGASESAGLTEDDAPSSSLTPLAMLNTSGWDVDPDWLMTSCGPGWRDMLADYVAWHAAGVAALRSRDAEAAKRYPLVVFRCRLSDKCGGVGDRLVGVASVFLYALRQRRLFFLDWELLDGFMTSPFPGLDWRWRGSTYLLGRKPVHVDMHQCRYSCLWTGGQRGHAKDLAKPVVVLSINRGPLYPKYSKGAAREVARWLRRHSRNGDAGLGCLYRSIMTPAPALREFLAPFLGPFTRPDGAVVAAHIRQGDTAMIVRPDGSSPSNTKNAMHGYFTLAKDNGKFFACAARLAAQLAAERGLAADNVKVLLVSDSQDARAAAKRHFGAQLLDTGIRAQHISWLDRKVNGKKFLGDRLQFEASVLRTSLAEWYLLTLARAVVTHASGFSRTAAAYGSTHNAIHMAMEGCRRASPFELGDYGAGI